MFYVTLYYLCIQSSIQSFFPFWCEERERKKIIFSVHYGCYFYFFLCEKTILNIFIHPFLSFCFVWVLLFYVISFFFGEGINKMWIAKEFKNNNEFRFYFRSSDFFFDLSSPFISKRRWLFTTKRWKRCLSTDMESCNFRLFLLSTHGRLW